jgi:hypothetical protein
MRTNFFKRYSSDLIGIGLSLLLITWFRILMEAPPPSEPLELVTIEVTTTRVNKIRTRWITKVVYDGLPRGISCPCPKSKAWEDSLFFKKQLILVVDKNSIKPYQNKVQEFLNRPNPLFVHKIVHHGNTVFESQASQ